MIGKFNSVLAVLMILGLSWTGTAAHESGDAAFRGMYFAPMTSLGLWRMRMENGSIREFEPTASWRELRSVDGWTARMEGETTFVRSPKKKRPQRIYEFHGGVLVRAQVGKSERRPVASADPIVYAGETVCPLWPDESELGEDGDLPAGTWERDSRRLKLWFESPNQTGTFIAFLLVLAISLAVGVRRPWVRILGGVSAFLALAALLWTGSRGCLIAATAAVLAIVVCALRVRGRLTWRRVAIVAVLLSVVLALVLAVGSFASGRTRTGYGRSDALRREVWSAVPQMMCDAPSGWGTKVRDAGAAYSQWYSDSLSRRWVSLVNDHLTILVLLGWLKGAAYLFLWFAGTALLLMFAWRGGSPIPAALWISLGVSSFFNFVMFVPLLHWIPVASLVLLALDRRWLERRIWAGSAVFGLIAAFTVLGGIWTVGSHARARVPSICRSGEAVLVGGSRPSVWVVDDDQVLGAIATTMEIRQFYRMRPDAQAIGYVKSLAALEGQTGIRRLALAGERGVEFLEKVSANGFRGVPPEIVFLSPPFPPSKIPLELLAKAKVSVVMGEFYARYFPELAKPVPGIVIAKGAEMYIPAWMRYCVD